jgi:hypothetical protein
MDNSPKLPIVAIVVAVLCALVVLAQLVASPPEGIFHLSEIQIGLAAAALTLAIFGVQGLISVALEGRQLRLGRIPPRLTNPLTVGIVALVIVVVAASWWLASGVMWSAPPGAVAAAAGVGCLALAVLLVFYKEGFVGDEVGLDRRDDGVPW